MRIQWKILFLVFFVWLGTVSALVWKSRSHLLSDRAAVLTDANSRQVAVMARLAEARLQVLRDKLLSAASRRSAFKGSDSEFEVISLFRQSPDQRWTPVWHDRSASFEEKRWVSGHDVSAVRALPFAKVVGGDLSWARISDVEGRAAHAIMFSVVWQQGSTATQLPTAQAQEEVAAAAALPETVESTPPFSEASESATEGQGSVLVAILADNPLADLVDEQTGSINTAWVVDDKGYVVSHTNKSYVGALLTEDSVVKEIVEQKKPISSGQYNDIEGRQVVALYEKVDNSNLFTSVSTPVKIVERIWPVYVQMALVTGVSVGLLGLVLAWLLGHGISRSLAEINETVASLARGEVPLGLRVANSSDEIGVLRRLLSENVGVFSESWQKGHEEVGRGEANLADRDDSEKREKQASEAKGEGGFGASENLAETKSLDQPRALSSERLATERRLAFQAFNEGFASTVKEPIMGILGHAQLVRTKTDDAELVSHAESIEREARRAKDVVDQLQSFERSLPEIEGDEQADLAQIVKAVLARWEAELSDDGVEVKSHLESIPLIRGSAAQLETAVTHLLSNAREAMMARPTKKLSIDLTYRDPEGIVLSIGDTGIGMSRDVKERAFEPFFKGFESPRRMGLGLTFVQAVLRQMGADCDIDATPGEGAKFKLKFKVTAAEKARFDQEKVQLGGKSAIEGEVAEKLPPPPPQSSLSPSPPPPSSTPSSSPPPFSPPLSPRTQPPPLAAKDDGSHPLKELAADEANIPLGEAEQDDDDAPEAFANVSLDRALESIEDEAGEPPGKVPFRVKIRRPKVNDEVEKG